MSAKDKQLQKVLTVSQSVGLAITIVVGAGLLVLPGLAYQQTGGAAIYVWILDLLLVLPLLVIFARLGARYPSAGGIAGFLQNAFSRRWGAAAEVLLIGTFGLGIPAIALTGGQYVAVLFGEPKAVIGGALILLLIAVAVNWRGAGVSGNIQRTLAYTLCGVLLAVAIGALVFGNHTQGESFAPPLAMDTWRAVLPAAGLVFFAFTGWEMLSFTAEEYKNPRRDFPLAVGISFVVVAVLYLLIAAAIQLTLPQMDAQTAAAPMAALAKNIVGQWGAIFISATAIVIILANLIGALWAASRLVFSSAREGLLPKRIAALDVKQTPRAAIMVCAIVFAAMLGVAAAELMNMEDMLRFAGQNFFFLYGLSVAAYYHTATTTASRILGAASLAVVLTMTAVFGWEMLYTLALLAIGYMWQRNSGRKAAAD